MSRYRSMHSTNGTAVFNKLNNNFFTCCFLNSFANVQRMLSVLRVQLWLKRQWMLPFLRSVSLPWFGCSCGLRLSLRTISCCWTQSQRPEGRKRLWQRVSILPTPLEELSGPIRFQFSLWLLHFFSCMASSVHDIASTMGLALPHLGRINFISTILSVNAIGKEKFYFLKCNW